MAKKSRDFITWANPSAEESLAYRVKCHFEFGNHAKVPASPPQGPKQFRVFFGARADEGPVRNNHAKAPHIVTREAVQTIEPSGPAAEDQSTGAGVGNHTRGKCQSNGLRCGVNRTEKTSTFESSDPFLLVNVNLAHRREIHHQAVVARAKTAKTVAPAADRGNHTG